MRKIVFFILLLFLVVPLSAQVVWGVRAGGAYSSLIQSVDDVSHSGARFGYTAAGLLEIPLCKKLSLRPEVAFTNQGGKYAFLKEGATERVVRTLNYYSVQVPVNLQFIFTTPEIMFGVFGGPYVDFSLFGRMKDNGVRRSILFGSGGVNDLRPFDLGVNLGLNVEYSNVFFVVQAFCGTLNRNSVRLSGESAVYQNNITVSLGYMFR